MAGSGVAHMRPESDPVLSVDQMVVEFPVGRGQKVHAVSGMNIDLLPGETHGILGESGGGTSSAGRASMQERSPTAGGDRLIAQARKSDGPGKRVAAGVGRGGWGKVKRNNK